MTSSLHSLIEQLKAQNAALQEKCEQLGVEKKQLGRRSTELDERNQQLDARNKHLEAQLDALKQRLFGRSSEKFDDGTPSLFEELAAEAVADIEASLMKHPPVPKAEKRKRNGRKPIPQSVPRRRTVLDLAESEKTCPHGHSLEAFGEDVTEEVDVIPAKIFVREFVRPKYKVCGCTHPECQSVHMADLPARPIEKGRPGPGLLAHIAVSKYADHLPLYRQTQIFERSGIDIHRSTMTDWLMTTGSLLKPIVAEMRRSLLAGNYLQADETTIRVQGVKKGKMHTGYLWGYGVPWGDVVYDFTMGRGQEYPARFLEGFAGHLQIDGYDGYNVVFKRGNVQRGGCWAHARRKFFDARHDEPERAKTVMAAIQLLYRDERTWKIQGLDPEARARARREHAGPMLESILKLLEGYRPNILPKSKMGEAITYAINEWQYLKRYIDVGVSEIDNNAIEHTLRPVALGRKNYLFAGSPAGGKAAAVFYSLITSAKHRGLNPWAYLRNVIERVSTHPQARIAELTPAGWAETADTEALAQD